MSDHAGDLLDGNSQVKTLGLESMDLYCPELPEGSHIAFSTKKKWSVNKKWLEMASAMKGAAAWPHIKIGI